MGRVYPVRNRLTAREEAMKVVLPDLDEEPELADRFLREIQVHASMQHPNIAALHSAQRVDGRLVMFLELVDGVSLEAMLRNGPLEVAAATGYILQVLAALAYAHERGVVHRDVKPANILIGPDGVVKLTDFGIARSADTGRLTSAGQAVGTPAYMSPEQILTGVVDPRSDIYSVGLTFYEMVTGRRAVEAATQHAMIQAQLTLTPPAPALVRPQVPEGISRAIERALMKDAGARFATALEFRRALEEPAGNPAALAAASFDPAAMARLTEALAVYLGPIARVLVSRAARTAGSLEELLSRLAAELPSGEDRKRFLASVRSAL